MNCELCGQKVSVSSSSEGTNSYVGEDAKRAELLEAELGKAVLAAKGATLMIADIYREISYGDMKNFREAPIVDSLFKSIESAQAVLGEGK